MLTTLRQLHGKFLDFLAAEVIAGRRSEGTLDYYRRQLRPFVQANGRRRVCQLVPYDLVQLGTSWHRVQAVQRLFSWGLQVGLINSNPFAEVERPPLGQRERILSRGELARLIWAAGRPARRLLLAMRHTLARPQEMRLLTWNMWHVDLRAFVLHDFKGRSRRRDGVRVRLIPLDDWMVRMLARWCGKARRDHIFADSRGNPWTRNGLRLAVRRARLRAGLAGGGEQIVPYSLRHTAATWATVAGVSDRTLADLMGHASTRTTARYQHLQAHHLAEAICQATRRA